MRTVALVLAVSALSLAFTGETRQAQQVTYSDHIAPIISAKCLPCHRPQGMAPFSLADYDEVRKRYALFREVTMKKQMPPTDATSDFGRVATEAPLTDEEIILIQEWVRQGLQEGHKIASPKLPNPTWRRGAPDVVVPVLADHTLPAEGSYYRRTAVVTLPDGGSLAAFDVLPASPQAVRFVRLAQRPAGSKSSPFTPVGVDAKQLIGSWAPGHFPWRLPAGGAYKIAPGSELVVEVLFHPIGRPDTGRVDLGLYWAKEPQHSAITRTLGRNDFVLPDDAVTTLSDAWTVDEDIALIAAYPEARELATQIRLTAYIPSKGAKTVLLVYSFDPSWLGSYVFEQPIRLPKGTRIKVDVLYDNARHALRETVPVRFGPKESDELFWMHLQYVPASQP